MGRKIINRLGWKFLDITSNPPMSAAEIKNLQKAIQELRDSNDAQFHSLNEKVTPMYEAYTTISQGSIWIKYAFWFIGTVIGAILAIREYFKH